MAKSKGRLKIPFIDILPPLASREFEALEADIKVRGVLHPVCVDEDGNILDGHHRYQVDNNAPTILIAGLSEAEKIAFVLSSNNKRRNMTPEQLGELRKRNIETATKLKAEDPKKWTQAKIAVALGVNGDTVGTWLDTSNPKDRKACIDARLSVTAEAKSVIIEQSAEGVAQKQIAADLGISKGRVSQIITTAAAKNCFVKFLPI